MKDIHLLLQRSLAFTFYQQHLGMFFFVFFLMFGVVESRQIVTYHLSLIYGMFNSPLFLLFIMAIWLLYYVKCLHFVLQNCEKKEYAFLSLLTAMPRSQTFRIFFILFFTLLLPVTGYTVIILVTAMKNGFYAHAILIFAYQLGLLLLSAWIVVIRLHQKHILQTFNLPSLQIPIERPLSLFYTGHLLRAQRVGVLITKLFSIAVIYVVIQAMDPLDDVRIPLLAMLFGLTSHSFLIFETKRFENEQLYWLRALPFTLWQRFLNYLFVYVIVLLPEMLLLAGTIGRKISFIDWLLLYSLGVSFLVFLRVRLFRPEQNMDRYTQFLLWFFLVTFMLVLFKLSFLIPILLISLAFLSFRTQFYRYEPSEF